MGHVKRSTHSVPLSYSLIVIDEVENYLADQIKILQACINQTTQAMLYVGDLAQQTQLCTIQNWESISEEFGENRKVVLNKVYRNTRPILEYIRSLGYTVTIPDGIRDGVAVQEIQATTHTDELAKIQEIIKNNQGTVIGILAKNTEYLEAFQSLTEKHSNVHVLTINEAQGVEFDVVCLVGIHRDIFVVPGGNTSDNPTRHEQRRRVNRDLLYVALTRAMNELYIFTDHDLTSIVQALNNESSALPPN